MHTNSMLNGSSKHHPEGESSSIQSDHQLSPVENHRTISNPSRSSDSSNTDNISDPKDSRAPNAPTPRAIDSWQPQSRTLEHHEAAQESVDHQTTETTDESSARDDDDDDRREKTAEPEKNASSAVADLSDAVASVGTKRKREAHPESPRKLHRESSSLMTPLAACAESDGDPSKFDDVKDVYADDKDDCVDDDELGNRPISSSYPSPDIGQKQLGRQNCDRPDARETVDNDNDNNTYNFDDDNNSAKASEESHKRATPTTPDGSKTMNCINFNSFNPSSSRKKQKVGTPIPTPVSRLPAITVPQYEQNSSPIDKNEKQVPSDFDAKDREDGLTHSGTIMRSDTASASNCDERTAVALKSSFVNDSSSSKQNQTRPKRNTSRSKASTSKEDQKVRYSSTSDSDSDYESVSSSWSDSQNDSHGAKNRPWTMKLRRSTKNIRTVSDNNSNSDMEPECTTSVETRNQPCDFTGEEVPSRSADRLSEVQCREENKNVIVIDEDNPKPDSSTLPSGEASSTSADRLSEVQCREENRNVIAIDEDKPDSSTLPSGEASSTSADRLSEVQCREESKKAIAIDEDKPNSSTLPSGGLSSSTSSDQLSDVQCREENKNAIAIDEDKPNSSTLPSGELSSSKSFDTPVLNAGQIVQPKPSVPLKNFELVEEKVLQISERITSEQKRTSRSIFEKALRQHKVYNQRLVSNQTFSPRIQATQIIHKLDMKIDSTNHTAMVNSSLTVLPTVTDEIVTKHTKRRELDATAQRLNLMPYDYKIHQQNFATILEALPLDMRYHPEVHQCVSNHLYEPSEKSKAKLEVPQMFKEIPTNHNLKAEGATIMKDPDENDGDYVSVMNSFRDFCVQCKTFDCQFHITQYPDAATQAFVAIQYDMRALQRQKGELSKPNDNGPFTSFVPKKNNQLFDSPTCVDFIGPDKTKPGFIYKKTHILHKEDGMCCPFCNFYCGSKEKLSKHLSRYHEDTFYCREVDSGNKITANARTQASETLLPIRKYYHSRSLIPIQMGQFDRDSDDESDYSWYHDYRRNLMKDLADVSEKEKRIHAMWNRFLGCSTLLIADKDMPEKCYNFIQRHFMDLEDLEWELYQMLITFWERRLVSVIYVEKLMHQFHTLLETKDKEQAETPLTPRKKVILSRLHLIFGSLGKGAASRLGDAMRRKVGSNDIVNTPILPKPWPKVSRKTRITPAMRRRAEDKARPFFYPCFHAGKCDKANGCTCIENDNLCTKHCIWGDFGTNFFPGCSCTGDCSIKKMCPCRDANRECDPDICKCGASTDECRESCSCANMDVSLARKAFLLVGESTIENAGKGLFTKYALKKGDYIDEYIGEFVKREHQEGRSEAYNFDHSDDYVADAMHQGNKTRYLNHSLQPNIEAKHRFVNGEKRIAFFARHDIPAQAELFYSYGKAYNKIWHARKMPELCVHSDDDGYENEDE